MSERPYHYVLVRTDLTAAQQMVQAAHAAYEAGSKYGTHERNGSLVMCAVSDEEALQQAISRLEYGDIPHVVWREPDLGNEITSVATAPLPPVQRKAMRRFRMWQGGYTPFSHGCGVLQ